MLKVIKTLMHIIKRDGRTEEVSFDKISKRLEKICLIEPRLDIDHLELSQHIISCIHDGIKTSDLDEEGARFACEKTISNSEYGTFASRLIVSNMHKNTYDNFEKTMRYFYDNDYMISKDLIDILDNHAAEIDSAIVYSRDYLFNFCGFKVLEKGYLVKYNGVMERPQHMWMRVSIGIHGDDIPRVLETYELLSNMYFTHASPTLSNAGKKKCQMASCNLLGIEDSMEGIYKALTESAILSKHLAGIGLHISNVRSKGSIIRGTGGESEGIIKLLKLFDSTVDFAKQGSVRKGSMAIYIEPWHAEIMAFLELRKNSGDEKMRTRSLFTALWTNDLFMKHVRDGKDWYLMNPNISTGLTEVHSEEFEKMYLDYVSKGMYVEKIPARKVWNSICLSQIETGMPYMLFKDNVNRRNNQSNIGIVKSSNLCAEIMLYSDTKNTAVCNISTFSLSKFAEFGEDGKTFFNYKKLHDVTKIVTRNMNIVIDKNFDPTENSKRANQSQRSIALGIQGFADLLFKMKVPFESEEALILAEDIAETIQHAGWEMSVELAKVDGVYERYADSPMSKGILQHDMWGHTPSGRMGYDWDVLRKDIIEHGVRNSMITAYPPTASTGNVLGNYESFEPPPSNIFMKKVLAGEFLFLNNYMVKDLRQLGLWTPDNINTIIKDRGSIQNLDRVPEDIKKLYKTVWEIPQKTLINLSRARAPYIDHSQSLNIYIDFPTIAKLTAMHLYTWGLGLKTGMYYLRTQNYSNPTQFTVKEEATVEAPSCSIDDTGCVSCSG